MSMHMIHGVRANTSSKRKKNNSKKLQQAKLEHYEFLRKMGIDPAGKKRTRVTGTPLTDLYRSQQAKREETKTTNITYSNAVPGNGNKKETIKYTGDELAGVALMHKQALNLFVKITKRRRKRRLK